MDDLNGLANKMADRFFKERDKELLEKLKEEVAGDDSREALAAASGISDTSVLDNLIASGINPDTIASVSLIPLVAVAWADRKMEAKEREAILKAATEAGIVSGSASYSILETWLNEQPDDQLLASWTLALNLSPNRLAEFLDLATRSPNPNAIFWPRLKKLSRRLCPGTIS